MKMIKLLFLLMILIAVLTVSGICNAQEIKSSKLACINISEDARYFYKSMYLLQGLKYGFEVEDCLLKDYEYADSLDPISRIKFGINQIELMKLTDSRLNLTVNDLKLFTASGKIKLSKLYLEKNEFTLSETVMKEAKDIYISIIPYEVKNKESEKLVTKIAVGLVRTNNIFDALQVLNRLSVDNPNRAYLTAEMYFSLGYRELASEKYEKWINLGCKSNFLMLLSDEFGEKWDLLLPTFPPNLTICDQLPVELRARFETLKEQYGHPKNLPARNFPPVLYPNR